MSNNKAKIQSSQESIFVEVDYSKRLSLLITFVQKLWGKKIVIFTFGKHQIDFLSNFFLHLKLGFSIYPTQSDEKTIQLATQEQLKEVKNYDWIIFYDPLIDFQSKLHQSNKKILYFVDHFEAKYSEALLKKENLKKQDFNDHKIYSSIKDNLTKLMAQNYYLHVSAIEAFKYFVAAYQQVLDKTIFNFDNLNPYLLCQSFGFEVPPKINNFKLKKINDYEIPQKKQTSEVNLLHKFILIIAINLEKNKKTSQNEIKDLKESEEDEESSIGMTCYWCGSI